MGPGRHEKTVSRLAKIARTRAEELQARLQELERAKVVADAALLSLDASVKTEDPGLAAAFDAVRIFTIFAEGAAPRRRALAETGATLAAEIAVMRKDLADAFGELKKLEHLIEVTRRATLRRQARAEATSLDALAVMRRY